MGKMKDVLIEIEELREHLDLMYELHETQGKTIGKLTVENARLAEVARKEMMSANKMRKIIDGVLRRIDSELTVAFHEIDDAVCRDH